MGEKGPGEQSRPSLLLGPGCRQGGGSKSSHQSVDKGGPRTHIPLGQALGQDSVRGESCTSHSGRPVGACRPSSG